MVAREESEVCGCSKELFLERIGLVALLPRVALHGNPSIPKVMHMPSQDADTASKLAPLACRSSTWMGCWQAWTAFSKFPGVAQSWFISPRCM